ncbi:zinc-dependent alcohol dehydrogenase family protein [Pseudonocardia acidicola]|uniref:Zinc-dependent alcohol dehydrogenase family protein n=1 Tax=Pseudonocardia acidicola TaxID=2724939 RepID=A0ABX1S759_9PSEU|nr:zinc-dependent alcohol dehydrogenase family protein [Pseudonocardia acidicola]NMH97389.1 zinc-dependent alcohol dehydrogenase family protein [Pseudonocardia acidicola]
MRAIVFEAPGQLAVSEVLDPTPGPKDVVIEVAGVGICGTDIHVFEGHYGGTEFPIIPGHEATGTVVAVGAEVTRLGVGDRVAVDPTLSCGECDYCVNGRYNLCLHWNSMGVTRDNGASAQFLRAPARNTYRLPPEVDLYQASMIEPLSCAMRAFDVLPRRLGEHYLIYGAGTMGLLLAQLAPRAGAATVCVVDPNQSRHELAREVGVETVAASADDLDRDKWDVVIDASGVVAAIEDGLPRVKPGGTFQQFGVSPAEARATYSPISIVRDEVSMVGSAASLNTLGRAVEMFAAGAIRSIPMISHAFALADYAEAMDMFRRGVGGKLQIRPNAAESIELSSVARR